jgi:hypothetical protein
MAETLAQAATIEELIEALPQSDSELNTLGKQRSV